MCSISPAGRLISWPRVKLQTRKQVAGPLLPGASGGIWVTWPDITSRWNLDLDLFDLILSAVKHLRLIALQLGCLKSLLPHSRQDSGHFRKYNPNASITTNITSPPRRPVSISPLTLWPKQALQPAALCTIMSFYGEHKRPSTQGLWGYSFPDITQTSSLLNSSLSGAALPLVAAKYKPVWQITAKSNKRKGCVNT